MFVLHLDGERYRDTKIKTTKSVNVLELEHVFNKMIVTYSSEGGTVTEDIPLCSHH